MRLHHLLTPALILAFASLAPGQFYNDFELEPHGYFTKKPRDPMSLLLEKIKAGDVKLDEPVGKRLVERLLKELDVEKDTQVLVFSKTSLQKRAVSYQNPRAIYFNDELYFGWMPNGRIEIASFDPELGPLFYFQRPLEDKQSPLFARTRSCLGCHAGDATNFLPGPLGRSIFPDRTGRSMKSVRGYRRSGHQIPMEIRWGGWFVSGRHGELRHMGNALAERKEGEVTIDREQHANLERLDKFFQTDAYPAPGSDVAALLVFDHQVTMHYRLVEAAYRTRQSLFDSKLSPDETDRSKLKSGRSVEEFEEAIEMVVDYLLFKEEVTLPPGIEGDPAFRRAFLTGKRVTKSGRSLRDLRLADRIFEHRCSYMIYSKSFESLPAMLKAAVYDRLHEILTAKKAVKGFEYLAEGERAHILQILRETKDDLPANWGS